MGAGGAGFGIGVGVRIGAMSMQLRCSVLVGAGELGVARARRPTAASAPTGAMTIWSGVRSNTRMPCSRVRSYFGFYRDR